VRFEVTNSASIIERHKDRQTDRQTGRQAGKQADRPTDRDRQTDGYVRKTSRQTDRSNNQTKIWKRHIDLIVLLYEIRYSDRQTYEDRQTR
jgi:hypothetical protein